MNNRKKDENDEIRNDQVDCIDDSCMYERFFNVEFMDVSAEI
ncbi:Predicted protein [Anoxybacillus flavithermus WK1]|uniref:Uncharacterized protein n=1 Tax=Anoxybacillus flavithermus (strain DSM 21510 / WK1) TaxID=491915 RepID=B7GMT9_ANOFW|nr:Predicted protein [Anoxybacillus flavithermus WK1]